MLIAILFGGIYAGARTARAYLIKPFYEDLIQPQLAQGSTVAFSDWVGGWLGEEAPDAGDAAPGQEPSGDTLAEQVRAAMPQLLLFVALILTLLPLSHFGQEYLTHYVLGRVLVDIQQALCGTLLGLPLGFHQRTSRGETLSRVMNDAQRAHLSLEILFVDVVQSLLLLLTGVVTLLLISWQLTLTLAFVGPPVAGVIAFFGRRIRTNAQRRQESQGDVTHRLLQILNGIKVIKAFGAQRGEEDAFSRENLRFFKRNMKVVKYRSLSRSAVETITNLITLGMILAGVGLILAGWWGLNAGALGAFLLVMQSSCYRPMKDLTKGWTKLQEALPSAHRFFALLDAEPETEDAPGALDPVEGPKRSIRFDKVSFSYGREPVLRDVSLEVAAGDVVAIVGRTGSGKTTLADLLLRFYDPDAGAIEIDGIDLRDWRRKAWLRQVAVVSQEPFLFSGTIRENIRYGRPEASNAELEAAAAAAHVDEFTARLEQGLDTDVGEAGGLLSGGQRQRITIARAILRNPRVLIFDEATSALDAQSERYVQEAIESLLAGRTVFIIAHRLSTVRHADKIVVLDDGAIAETGTHESLLAQGGLYRDLVAPKDTPERIRDR